MTWHLGRMAGFDLESTGPNPLTARIVTACIVQCGGDQPMQVANWLSDVDGEEIPQGASDIHKVTTEKARAEGAPLREVVGDLIAGLTQVIASGVPVVAMNARYDLSLLDREAQRFGLDPLPAGPVIDPFVIDKEVDRYRPGKRTLTALCQHYQVRLDELHTAQVGWAAEQAASLQEHFRKTRPDAVVEGAWPLIPRQTSPATQEATS